MTLWSIASVAVGSLIVAVTYPYIWGGGAYHEEIATRIQTYGRTRLLGDVGLARLRRHLRHSKWLSLATMAANAWGWVLIYRPWE